MTVVDWPVELRGVTESIVTTEGPNGRWNAAALGLHADANTDSGVEHDIRARTWGRTRTWRNFRERGGGYVQFTRDPVDFVDAALAVREEDDPVLNGVDAWARVEVRRLERGESGGTQFVDWALTPIESVVERQAVPTTNRGYGAVVEATVAASRLGVDSYDSATLRDRLDYFEEVALKCGGPREREAINRIRDLVDR
ncbi:MAG: DUF447 domain-containing protein [Haloarculaceae archaeon]